MSPVQRRPCTAPTVKTRSPLAAARTTLAPLPMQFRGTAVLATVPPHDSVLLCVVNVEQREHAGGNLVPRRSAIYSHGAARIACYSRRGQTRRRSWAPSRRGCGREPSEAPVPPRPRRSSAQAPPRLSLAERRYTSNAVMSHSETPSISVVEIVIFSCSDHYSRRWCWSP